MNSFPERIARLVEVVTRTATMTVWPEAVDRERYAERRQDPNADEGDELESVFGGDVQSIAVQFPLRSA